LLGQVTELSRQGGEATQLSEMEELRRYAAALAKRAEAAEARERELARQLTAALQREAAAAAAAAAAASAIAQGCSCYPAAVRPGTPCQSFALLQACFASSVP
jgi:hypothetical protein